MIRATFFSATLSILLTTFALPAAPEDVRTESAKLTGEAQAPTGKLLLWYRQPASKWMEALPIGNGRLGAMIYGGVASETLQLNEDTIWEGYPHDPNNPKALAALPEIRQLLFADKSDEATKLITDTMMGVPPRIKSYQPLGDLVIETPELKSATNYRRSLDLETGVAVTGYESGGVRFTREVFASRPDNIIAVRISSDRPAQVNVDLSLNRERDAKSLPRYNENGEHGPSTYLFLVGRIMSQYVDIAKKAAGETRPGMRFEAHALIRPIHGTVAADEKQVHIRNADSVEILLAAATDYRGGEPGKLCGEALGLASARSFDQIRSAHVQDQASLFDRVDLNIGSAGDEVEKLPTDERLARLRKGERDPGMVVNYFQYGRYLLIACSRPGGMPANLQGMWNDKLNAAWNSDYHTNINIQMNYWPAEVTNLAECHEPLFDLMNALVEPGSKTAKSEYGARGWVVHHLTDPFLFTAPADGPQGVWPMGAAWLCQHVYEHYLFSGDKAFLANRAYPLMKGAAQFILDFLVEAPPRNAGRWEIGDQSLTFSRK